MSPESSVNECIEAMLAGNMESAERMLAADPAISEANIYSAAACGNADAVAAMLRDNPSLASEPGGPKSWEPILYASFSQVRRGAHSGTADVVRLLLEAGADPNASYIEKSYPDSPQSALYGATGVVNDPLVAEILLAAGANPNDGESIYHAAEGNHRKCLELLLKHGAELSARGIPWNNTPLYFILGYRNGHPNLPAATEGARWLLEHGADPNVTSYDIAETPLHMITRNRRSRATAEMLLDHGADPDLRNARGFTPYALAVRFGNAGVAELLRERGADEELSVTDRLLGACAAGDEQAARTILDEHPGLIESLTQEDRAPMIEAAAGNDIAALRAMLNVGFDIATRGGMGGTALHYAAWRGREEAVALLLSHDAPFNLRCTSHNGTPLDWALHGSESFGGTESGHPGVVERLIAAGSEIPAADRGSAAVVEILRRARATM